jgi:hypothetical protein
VYFDNRGKLIFHFLGGGTERGRKKRKRRKERRERKGEGTKKGGVGDGWGGAKGRGREGTRDYTLYREKKGREDEGGKRREHKGTP